MRDRLTALRSVHPFPSFLVAAITTATVPFADQAAPLSRFLDLGLGMLLYQFAIGLVNDLVDLPDDRRTKPWKPLVRGAASPTAALVAAIVCVAGGLALTSGLSHRAWLVGLAALGCGLAYDLYFKRTQFSWVPYAIGLPLVPVWVFVASDAWRPLLWWSFPLGGVLGFALNLANEAPDAGRGEASGLSGRLGERRSRALALLGFGLAGGVLAMLLLPVSLPRALFGLAIDGIAMAIAPASTRLFGRDGLFGLLAAASALLALLFLSAIG